MPDGRSYFWIARTADSPADRYLGPQKSFAIGLGCDLAHADKLIYSAGIDFTTPDATVPIGAGCKICVPAASLPLYRCRRPRRRARKQ